MSAVWKEIDPAKWGRAARAGAVDCAPVRHPPTARLWLRGCAASRVAPDDPASLLVTDFSRERAWTVVEERSVDEALREMKCAGVGALLVMRSEIVTGLVTCFDIQGRRPLESLRPSGPASRAEIQVGHVMTPWDRVTVLDWRSISTSRVRHVEEWARNTRATHALLVDKLDGAAYVRGLLSRAHVERSLGRSLQGVHP